MYYQFYREFTAELLDEIYTKDYKSEDIANNKIKVDDSAQK